MLAPAQFDLTGDFAIGQGTTWGIGFQIYGGPNGTTLIDTSLMSARFTVRAGGYDGAVVVDGSNADGRIVLGNSPGAVARSTAYLVGAEVSAVGSLFVCTTAGTTDSGPVVFDDTIGHTTNDGTVVWTCIDGYSGIVVNAYILLSATYTASLVDWGMGRWDLELQDGSTVLRVFEGYARLSREVSY